MKQIINQKIDEYNKTDPDKAKDWQNAGLLLDMLAGGLSSPGEGFLGSLAGAANSAVAQMIKGMVNDGTLEKGGLGHILAHGIAGAAIAAANGGDLLSGALTAGGAEALAPIIAEFLYGKGKTPEDLTADEKNTLSAIIGILGTGAGALTGDSAIDAIIGDSVATNAVENNHLGAGVNIGGWQIGANQVEEFAKELQTCSSQAECDAVKEKWHDLSIKQSGLSEREVEEWYKKLDATFEGLFAQCNGDAFCNDYLELQKEIAKTTHLGVNEGLGSLGLNLKHALDIKDGNWGSLALDALNDFGDFLPAVAFKPIDKAVEKVIEFGGEIFIKTKGIWSKADPDTLKILGVKPSTGTDIVPVSPTYYPDIASIPKDSTGRLSQNIVLENGQIIPKGSIVTTNGDLIKVSLSDGTIVKGNLSKLQPGSTATIGSHNINNENFFKNSWYTDKVKNQAASGDYHGFPSSVDHFSGAGKMTEIIGGDGITRYKLEIPGEYRGRTGVFEYIRDPDGKINHRLFVPDKK
ncbi:MAG TPA: VENN motif pre-toxin domain-containing protein [Candidatus Ignatzschineria merdigallinarum]|uniref:VENN motif pre-toxin domain-containing protein n=1 Tax=Candidatus Ignatzschineria merdigallinarum TaxID=2838621 RepID=A0A9D1Q4D9_9GAMM|nr:VENN motif pre-toxin domain-containing protein [Candidatus Ignatzschineria merdigallinarum]